MTLKNLSYKTLLLLLAVALLLTTACSKRHKDDLKPYRDKTADQLFSQGEHELSKHHWGPASKTFAALDALYPFSPYDEQAQTDLIYAYYKKGDTGQALAATDRYIRLYPRGKHIEYAYYMKGLVSDEQNLSWAQRQFGIDPAEHDLNSKKQAYLAFSDLVTRFPESSYAPDAALRMAKIRNILAHKQVILANFYLKRKAYVAAINRASDVVQHYQGSPEVPKALAILVKAYRGEELNGMADNTLKILQASYPNSRELKSVQKS